MVNIQFATPFKAPPGWLATPITQRSYAPNFPPNLSLSEALRFVEEELQALGLPDVTLFSNVDQINNERLRKQTGNYLGVSVRIGRDARAYWLACDQWMSLEHNLYALHLTLRSIRTISQWGVLTSEQLLRGTIDQTAIVPSVTSGQTTSASTTPDWMRALGLGQTATLEDAIAVYRRRAKAHGEDAENLLHLNQAMESARQYFGSSGDD